ncbi:zf-HC2 domain-containing protein [Mannheimia haemolytica]
MNCRQVTRLISDSKERKLTLKEKIGVKTHLIICPYCHLNTIVSISAN